MNVIKKGGSTETPNLRLGLLLGSASRVDGGCISPWIDGAKDKHGNWCLPEYPCEIKGLAHDDPRNRPWKPGDYDAVIDGDSSEAAALNETRLQKSEEVYRSRGTRGKVPPGYLEMLKVPHMPGQPLKEMFAKLKAVQPRIFEDRFVELIHNDLPQNWKHLARKAQWAEGFGLHRETSPAEWAGQEDALTPAAYRTPRVDCVNLCVGVAQPRPPPVPIEGAEFDFLELLYARDQDGNIIQIREFQAGGIKTSSFWSISFTPPEGTSSITPFACFKIRGVWQGAALTWDPKVKNPEMAWFTSTAPELRGSLDSEARKTRMAEDVTTFPENSWEGNCAKDRAWNDPLSNSG